MNGEQRQALFNHMSQEHGLTLTESEMNEIELIINPRTYPDTNKLRPDMEEAWYRRVAPNIPIGCPYCLKPENECVCHPIEKQSTSNPT